MYWDDILFTILPIAFWIVVIALIVSDSKKKKARAEQEKAQKEELTRHGTPVTSDALTEKYRANPVTIRAAEKFAESLTRSIEWSKSNGKKNISCKTVFSNMVIGARTYKFNGENICTKVGSCEGSYYDVLECRDLINFTSENLKPLQGRDEMLGFVRAVALNAYDMINQRYTKDESEIAGEITIEESLLSDCAIDIKFEYSAPNEFYTAPAEW